MYAQQPVKERKLSINFLSAMLIFIEGASVVRVVVLKGWIVEKREAFHCPFCGAPYRELIPAGTVQVKCRYCGAMVLVPPRLGGLLQLCPNHHEMLAVGICNECGKNFCGDCLFVTNVVGSGEGAQKGYFHFCPDCMKKKEEREKTGWIIASAFSFVFVFLPGLFIIGIPGGGTAGFIMLLMGFFFILLPFLVKTHKKFPTVRMVMEKLSELNKRAEKVRAAMSPQEVEDLYRRMLVPDPYTGKVEHLEIDYLIKEYMQSGLSRKEAILKIASEEGLEIKLGFHIPPTMDDALYELKKEMKKAEPAKKEIKMSEKTGELYEQLLYVYTSIRGGGRQVLENEIKSLMKQGLSREEAIYNLADKERLIEKMS